MCSYADSPPSPLSLSVPGTVRSMGNTVVGNDPVLLSDKTCPPQPSSSIQQLAGTETVTGPKPSPAVLEGVLPAPQAATCALLSSDVLTRTPEQLRPPKTEWEPTEGDVKQGEANMVDLLLGKKPHKEKGNVLQMGKQAQKCYETCFKAEVEHRGGGPSSSKFMGPESPCLTTWPPEACLHLTPWAAASSPGFQIHWAPGFLLPQHMSQGKAGRPLASLKSNREIESGQVLA